MAVSGDIDENAWAADMLYGPEEAPVPPVERPVQEVDEPGEPATAQKAAPNDAAEPVDLDAPDHTDHRPTADVNAGSKKVGALLAAGVVLTASVIVGALLAVRDEPSPSAPQAAPPTAAAVPVTASAAPRPAHDQAVPYTASADCPPGSTSAQALTDTTTDSAWVCVRGTADARVDGQVLRVDFGRTYALSAVSVTPGWVAKTPGGKDEWLQHRVVSRLQYVFNDDARTVFTQDTGTTHGPVTAALPHPVLASRVTVTVLATARPPVSPLPTSDPGSPPTAGFPESMLGEGGAPLGPTGTSVQTGEREFGVDATDPVDATFAVSALTFFGHPPR